MYKVYLFAVLLSIIPSNNFSTEKKEPKSKESTLTLTENQVLYSELNLEKEICYKAFDQAMQGYKKLRIKNKDIVTLIDFTKPSTEKRLIILNLKEKKMLLKSYVAHGKRSGDNFAKYFSNKNGSHQSSLGFYTTGETYKGRNGYSLILNGQEKGINDLARTRAIVIHAADYANPSVIKNSGRLGRSFGCPALPEDINNEVIDIIKNGTLLYIYADNKNYLSQSKVLSQKL